MEQIPAQVTGNAFDGIDADTFQRVWNRVVPDQSLSPIALGPIEPGQAQRPIQSEEPAQPTEPARPEAPIQPETPAQPPSAQLLPELMDQLCAAAQRSQCLVRQTSGSVNRAFANSAEEQRRGLKRLSAAYFLQTGQWYTPGRNASARVAQSRAVGLSNVLRERYMWERQWEQACRGAAQRAQDEALCSLLTCLAQESAGRSSQIRGLLEQTVRLS